jgi:hypothetical protein
LPDMSDFPRFVCARWASSAAGLMALVTKSCSEKEVFVVDANARATAPQDRHSASGRNQVRGSRLRCLQRRDIGRRHNGMRSTSLAQPNLASNVRTLATKTSTILRFKNSPGSPLLKPIAGGVSVYPPLNKMGLVRSSTVGRFNLWHREGQIA